MTAEPRPHSQPEGSAETSATPDVPEGWRRPYHAPGGGDAYLFFVVFGARGDALRASRSRHRTRGVPAGVELAALSAGADPEALDSFRTGHVAEPLARMPDFLRGQVAEAGTAVVMRGPVADPPDLVYLRDSIGVLTAMLECGGVAILDLLSVRWWDPVDWRRLVFEPDRADPSHHVTIYASPDERHETRHWYHTRGMRTFGRPDISVRRVPRVASAPARALCNRLISLQALGAVLPDGEPVRLPEAPEDMTYRHGGDLDDVDYNNVHVEMTWPQRALTS